MRLPALLCIGCLAAPAADPLLFSYFTRNGEDGLHLAASDDGLTWRVLNNGQAYLAPTVGESKLMRDPSIARGPDGTYHMVWTTSWQGRTLGYASSRDLRTWTAQRTIPVTLEGDVVNCWAPELFYDASARQFLIVWASTIRGRYPETGQGNRDYNHRQYAIRTRDFVTFTAPALFLDPGFQVIDAAIFRAGQRYAVVAKNETLKPEAKYLFLTFADSLDGPWSKPSAPISGREWAEGPTPIQARRRLVHLFRQVSGPPLRGDPVTRSRTLGGSLVPPPVSRGRASWHRLRGAAQAAQQPGASGALTYASQRSRCA